MELRIIQKRIFEVRGHKVMFDKHLAELYGVPTKSLNLAVKRNISRFPSDFMFQLSKREYKSLRFQIETSKQRGGTRYLPHVFTEHGVAMLSTVLRSKKAVDINISIIRAFVMLRQLSVSHKDLVKRIEQLEKKYDKKFENIHEALNYLLSPPNPPRKKIGYKRHDEE